MSDILDDTPDATSNWKRDESGKIVGWTHDLKCSAPQPLDLRVNNGWVMLAWTLVFGMVIYSFFYALKVYFGFGL